MQLSKPCTVILDRIMNPICVRDRDMNMVDMNPAAERVSRWSLQDSQGQGRQAIVIFDDEMIRISQNRATDDQDTSPREFLTFFEGKLGTRSE